MASESAAKAKAKRFDRLAEKRVTEALHRLRLVGNLSNTRIYAYSEEHVRQMFEALEAEMKQVKAKFRQEGSGSVQKFSFKR